jgi:hypothetical protein
MPKKDKPVTLEDIEDVGIARGDRYYKEALRSSPRVHDGVTRGCQGKSSRIPPGLSGRCKHRLINIEPIVSIRVEGGYTSRCLLCGTSGPARSNAEAARRVLLDQLVSAEE